MAASPKTVSALISSQLPDFIKADHPKFKRFVELYYQWLETNNAGGISNTAGNTIYQATNIADYRDIDLTHNDFLKYLKEEILPYFPENTSLDLRKILKSAREFYSQKGSEESIKWLFKALFNEAIEVNYPKEQILITSDGKWKKPRAFRITVGESNKNLDVNLLEKRLVVGSLSGATCIIESANRTIDPTNGFEVIEIYISNIKKYFENGEFINVNYVDANGDDKVFTEKIIGTISTIRIDSNQRTDPFQKRRGLNYNIGDPVVVTGGLATTLEANDAVAIVGNVTVGSIDTVVTTYPGFGYIAYDSTNAHSEIIVLSSPSDDPNSNANTDLRVLALNLTACTSNSQNNFLETITYDTTVIDYLKDVVINTANLAAFTVNNRNALISVTETDEDDALVQFSTVWANGNNQFDAQFTGKIGTSSTGIFGQGGGSAVSGDLLVYDIKGANGSLISATDLPIILGVGAQLNVASVPPKTFTVNNPQITQYYIPTSTSSMIVQALSIASVNTGGVALVSVIDGGYGFRSAPAIQITSHYDTHLSQQYSYSTERANKRTYWQSFRTLGKISHVGVLNGGAGYNVNDTLTFDGRGYGTTAKVAAVSTGGVITSVEITNRGEGHTIRPEIYVNRATPAYTTITGTANISSGNNTVIGVGTLFTSEANTRKLIRINSQLRRIVGITNDTHLIVNTAFYTTSTGQAIQLQNGTEPTLVAYLVGDGVENTVNPTTIGRIRDLRLVYRGYDYVTTPNVSLKVVDTIVNPIPEVQSFTETEYVYQGSSLATSSFRANVKQFVRSTGLLRLYNYSGTINPAIDLKTQNGVFANIKTTATVPAPTQYPASVIATGLPNPMYYGNGKAKANALFANGLIEFNGFFLNTDGFLSADKVIQDGDVYHNFSYIVQSEKNLVDFKTPLKNIIHPAGMSVVSKTVLKSNTDKESLATSNVSLIKPTIFTAGSPATITIANSFLSAVTGANTKFTENKTKANVGDLLIINDTSAPLRSISKIISSVTDDTSLSVTGDFIYVGQGKLRTNTACISNVWVHVTGNVNAVSSFVTVGDKLRINVTNNQLVGTVNVSGTTVTGNTTGSNTTYFVGNVIVGSEITINNEVRLVTVVGGAGSLTVNTAFTNSATNKYIFANSAFLKEVVTVSANNIRMNTALFANLNSVVYQIVPTYTDVGFKIITLTSH